MMAHRTSPLFAYTAKEDGKIIKSTDKGIIVQYKDGKTIGIETGRQFGRAEGSIFPFDIEAVLKEGDSFKRGAPLVYNTGYFQLDPWNPGQLVAKTAMTAKTVLWETKQTHEDSSSISQKLAQKLGTQATYDRHFMIDFNQNVHNVVKPGQELKPQDILMSIEDEITSGLGSFGEGALATLKGLSRQSPKANYYGIVDRIEVFYHGDKDQMSPTLKKLADFSDNFIIDQAKSTGKPKFTGRVTDDYRVDGTPLGNGKAVIRFYITTQSKMGVAD